MDKAKQDNNEQTVVQDSPDWQELYCIYTFRVSSEIGRTHHGSHAQLCHTQFHQLEHLNRIKTRKFKFLKIINVTNH